MLELNTSKGCQGELGLFFSLSGVVLRRTIFENLHLHGCFPYIIALCCDSVNLSSGVLDVCNLCSDCSLVDVNCFICSHLKVYKIFLKVSFPLWLHSVKIWHQTLSG